MNELDEIYMQRAIELAKLGEGWCHPNPKVGAVIVKDDRIIGEGFHERYGQLHAERNAIKSLSESAEGATIYVTLEPCCHQGKTPPCTEAIIENKIKRVVIGSKDPNPKVFGKGVEQLKAAGIEVVEDFMKDECDELNPVFFHYIQTKTPYVTLKYAMTMDGKIATRTGASKWISGEASREYVHFMRHANMGILSGIGSVIADDPMLNSRLPDTKDPVRIICDDKLRIPLDSQIVKTSKSIETIVACAYSDDAKIPEARQMALEAAGISIINVPGKDGHVDIKRLMEILGKKGIDSVLVEGGGIINEACLRAEVVNEICMFLAPKIFGGSAKSPVEGDGVSLVEDAYRFSQNGIEYFGDDIMIRFVKESVCLQEL